MPNPETKPAAAHRQAHRIAPLCGTLTNGFRVVSKDPAPAASAGGVEIERSPPRLLQRGGAGLDPCEGVNGTAGRL
jgi:hypothetical protein